MSEPIWYFLATGTPCIPYGSAVKQLELKGIITRMQILYWIMQQKPHSCIGIELVYFDMDLKIFICPSHIAN